MSNMMPYLYWLDLAEEHISDQCQLKVFPATKYNVRIPGHGQLDDPFFHHTEVKKISMDYDDPLAGIGTHPSPFTDDEDFKILEAPSG